MRNTFVTTRRRFLAALAATDYYLTVFVYNYPFHTSAYLVTWAWYAAICLLGHGLLNGRPPGHHGEGPHWPGHHGEPRRDPESGRRGEPLRLVEGSNGHLEDAHRRRRAPA